MHTLKKIKYFRALLYLSYPFAFLICYPLALFFSKKSKAGLFFFFDRYELGGSQRVHINILNSIPDIDKAVFFTRKSADDILKEAFYTVPNTQCSNIYKWCENLIFRLLSVHYYSFFINRHKKAHVFSSNCTFFYDMLPFLNNRITKTELLHAFSYGKDGIEYFGLGNYKYLDNRMVIDKATKKNIEELYTEYYITEKYKAKIHIIENGVKIPAHMPEKDDSVLHILYSGRAGDPKRVYLLDKIAQHFIKHNLPVKFHFAGDVSAELSENVISHAVMHGNISRLEKLYEIYSFCDVVTIVSYREGFPMSIKEGMACGCIPMATALPGIMTHLSHLENALIINEVNDEEKVIEQGIANIDLLLRQAAFKEKLQINAYNYAKNNFDQSLFLERYNGFFTHYS